MLAVVSAVASGGWFVSRRKNRAEVENLKADAQQKEMNLARDYVEEFRENVAKPMKEEIEGLRRETGLLKRAVNNLKNAIQKIDNCPHRAECPVLDELQKQQGDEPDGEQGKP